ncbi:MAG: Fic family protein [Bacteroidales bacterium]|nr:Fic family protein [Bacteroidales bacterium]
MRNLIDILNEYNRLGIREQLDYDKFYLYSIITHSTAIEGSTVTEVEAQLLFDEGITSSKRTIAEQMMNLDLKAAYEYGMQWIKGHKPITVDWLVTLAAKVMAHTGSEYHSIGGNFSAAKGELRKLNVTAGFGGKSYMSYQKVPARLAEFCEKLNKQRKTIDASDILSVYDLSFWAHYELVTIHPWADGNGRTSRLLMNLIQMEFDVIPSKVLKDDKSQYIQALIDSRENNDISIFIDCMTQLHARHLQTDIDQYILSMSDEEDAPEGLKDKAVEKTREKSKETREKTREKIVMSIGQNPSITANELSKMLGITVKGVEWQLKQLKSQGVIRRVGADRGGYWEVVRYK